MSAQAVQSSTVKGSVQDWILLVLGVYLALAPIWTANASTGWFVVLGLLTVGAAIWGVMTTANNVLGWVLVALGVLIFLAPWFAGFAGGLAGWTAWLVGVATAAAGVVEINQASRGSASAREAA